jgi:hypothetical protein
MAHKDKSSKNNSRKAKKANPSADNRPHMVRKRESAMTSAAPAQSRTA